MTRPLTSTSVATNGADDTAGSMPRRFSPIGSIDPAKVPHITTPISETKTVTATSGQCWP